MATFRETMDILDYVSLGSLYEELGARSSSNSFFEFYIGAPTSAASQEAREILDESGDVRDIPLISEAGAGSVERFPTDDVEYIYVSAEKSAAPLNARGAPARVLQPTGSESRRVTLARTFNQIVLGMDAIMMLREPDQWILQQKGRREVSRQVRDFAKKHQVLKEVFFARMMTEGKVHVGENGEILDSGGVYTVDFGVPTSHTGQLQHGSSTIITVSWDDFANADILSDMDLLDVVAEEQNVEQPRHYWLNSSNKKLFRNNSLLKEWYGGIEKLNRALDGDAFEINNKVVHFYAGSYVDSDGATKQFIPTDKCVITPDLGPWLFNAIGRELVPTTIDVGATADDALNNLAEVYGDFAYAKLDHNPVSLSVFAGSNWLYAFRNPKSVWIADVVF